MGLYDDLQKGGYLHPQYNMVSIYDHQGQNNFNCGNYFLFSAIAKQLCAFPVWPGAANFYNICKVRLGLIKRNPDATDVSQQEIAGAACLMPSNAKEILIYGNYSDWCFNVSAPGKFSWTYFFGRFIDFPPFISMEAGQIVFLAQILWSIGLITTTFTAYGDTSEKCYKWLQVERVSGKHWICNGAIYIWRKLMQRKYAGGPKELFGIYFPNGDKPHPFIAYAPTVF
jgi:hypothetical protein